MNCCIISNLQYGGESCTISSQMKKWLEPTEVWLYRRMHRIPWREHMNNEEVLNQGTTRITYNQKDQLIFREYIMKKDSWVNLILTGHIWRQEKQDGTASNLLDEFVWTHGKTGRKRDNKRSTFLTKECCEESWSTTHWKDMTYKRR